MNIYKLLSLTNIIATPLAPAMLYAADVKTTLENAGYGDTFAMIVGGIAIAGIEGTGAVTFHNALEAWRRKSAQLLGVSIVFGVLYVIIMMGGIIYMDMDSGTLSLMVLLTVGAYVASGVYELFTDGERRRAAARADTTAAQAHEIEMVRQQRLLLNAEARLARAGVRGVQSDSPNTTNTPVEKHRTITPHGRAVKSEMSKNPAAGVREIARLVGCAPSTASGWMEYWREHNDAD